MRSNMVLLIPLLFSILLIDLYTYSGVKPLLTTIRSIYTRRILRILLWSISIATILGFVLYSVGIKSTKQAETYVYVGYLSAGFVLFYFPKLVFIPFVFTNDIRLLFIRIKKWLTSQKMPKQNTNTSSIKRSEFINQLGLIVAGLPFFTILHGITLGKTNFQLRHEKLKFANLPKTLNGLRIVQISDIHLGSLNKNYDTMLEAVELINQLAADLILFTGDMVNNFAEETEGWTPIFSKLNARIGKFSIMGNHDYGDYSNWDTKELKAENLARIKSFHQQIGFRLLLNQTEIIEKNGAQLALIGIENWGQAPFPQYGNLTKAIKNSENLPFKILLSHDPSHWDAEVVEKVDIDLTLAGHTHGMQFGFEKLGIKWSPIQYTYKRWGGLYREGNQYLYVNRGLGYIGFPGRIGMRPEITFIELV